MSQPDPPASALGAQGPHLAELYRILARCVGTYQSVAFTPQDAAAWLQHVDVQAARLAAVASYTRHRPLCGFSTSTAVVGCTCGLAAILDAPTAVGAGEARDGD